MDIKSKPAVSLSGVWKVASFLLAYLILGVWITGQITESNKSLKDDIKEVKEDVRGMSRRLDRHIDAHVEIERK